MAETKPEDAPQCTTLECGRETWNGKAGQPCCRSCVKSGGGVHGPDCDSMVELRETKRKCEMLDGKGKGKCLLCARSTEGGFPHCCRTCEQSGGTQHGPGCAAKNAGAVVAAVAVVRCRLCARGTEGGFPHCCRTCEQSGGKQHGPGCDAKNCGALVAASGGSIQLFLCNQQNTNIISHYQSFVGGVWPLKMGSVKSSMPPFNASGGGTVPNAACFNAQVYGPDTARAVLNFFDDDAVREVARAKNIRIPAYTLNKIVQGKMSRVRELIEAIQKQLGSDLKNPVNQQALAKLTQFISQIEAWQLHSFSDAKGWMHWLDTFFGGQGWVERLHIDVVLENFGFDSSIIRKIKEMKTATKENMSQYAVRWLSKAFEVFGLQGTTCDVVNLVFAMMNKQASATQPGRPEVLGVLREFAVILESRQFDRLWVPTHLVHDSEVDDMLAWLLLEFVHSCRGSHLKVMVQLPQDPELDDVKRIFQAPPCSAIVISDPSSKNAEAVKGYWRAPPSAS